MAKLSSKKRKQLPKNSFALPGKRKYAVDTKARARNALARVQQHGSPAEKKAVRAKVRARYSSIGKTGRRKKGGK
ncbi:hypothetical protein ACIP69_18505 [Streptomyces hygroscopicus]|uniref:hypothetical protein n=1 Tax=Streptomyces hygroscopicus TaxID=1912 RepID=UPI00380584F0